MHNLKVKALREAGELTSVGKVERIKLGKFLHQSAKIKIDSTHIYIRKVTYDNERVIRSQATGLSRIKDLNGIAENQEQIRYAHIRDEEELVKITI